MITPESSGNEKTRTALPRQSNRSTGPNHQAHRARLMFPMITDAAHIAPAVPHQNPHNSSGTGDQDHRPGQAEGGPSVTTGIKPNGKKSAQVEGVSARQRAGRRQSVMWAITQDKDLAGCHRFARGAEVSISWSASGPSDYVGLQNTRSRWGSPLAEQEIMRERRVELGMAVKNWLADGGSIIMGVGTVRHKRSQSLEQVLGAVKAAYGAMVDTPKWQKGDRPDYGITHIYTDYEYTWSPANGHHPHKNIFLFVDKELTAVQLEELGDSMFGRWSAGAVKTGLEAPNRKRGLCLDQITAWGADAAKAASYLAKGMAAEFTGAATKEASKKAVKKSLTAFEMLDVMANQRDAQGGMDSLLVAVYREYEAAFKDARSSWSRGAKKALKVDFITREQAQELSREMDELTGEEQEETPVEERFVVAAVPREQWRKIMSDMALRDRILEAVDDAKSPGEAQRNALVLSGHLGVEVVSRMVSMSAVDLDEVMPSHAEAVGRDLREAIAVPS